MPPETAAVPRLVAPSTNVTEPSFTVPEPSVAETLAVRVTEAVEFPVAMVAGFGDPLPVAAVGCALDCMVKFRHHEPSWPKGRLPFVDTFSVSQLFRYNCQVPVAPEPPNIDVKVDEPVGYAFPVAVGAGEGNVSL